MCRNDLFELFPRNRRSLTLTAAVEAVDQHDGDVLRASALDIVTKLEIQDLFAEMLRDKTVLFVTHDPLEALRLGNYIYLMRGSPAYLQKVSELSGGIPRDIKNHELHSFHGELLLAMRED